MIDEILIHPRTRTYTKNSHAKNRRRKKTANADNSTNRTIKCENRISHEVIELAPFIYRSYDMRICLYNIRRRIWIEDFQNDCD